MRKHDIPFWAAVAVAFVLSVLCFSFVHSAWSILLYAALVAGVALTYRLTHRTRNRRD